VASPTGRAHWYWSSTTPTRSNRPGRFGTTGWSGTSTPTHRPSRRWDAADAVEGTNDFGDRGYGGPNPPDGEHTYRFVLSAVDGKLDLPPGATREDLDAAVGGRVVEETRLEGTYAP
jgi:phosphatidylethanolamine-binding protein (PEBP) family uncharacterized protein